MHRRQLLIALAGSSVSVAGCAGFSAPNTKSQVLYPEVTIESKPVAERRKVDIDVSTNSHFSETHPGRFRIRFTNRAESAREFRFGAVPPYTQFVGRHVEGDSRLVIVPDSRENIESAEPLEETPDDETETATRFRLVPTEPINSCWYAGGVVASTADTKVRTLQPEESISEKYTILAHPLNEHCLRSGEYRFEKERYFGEDGPWGFSLILNNPTS